MDRLHFMLRVKKLSDMRYMLNLLLDWGLQSYSGFYENRVTSTMALIMIF